MHYLSLKRTHACARTIEPHCAHVLLQICALTEVLLDPRYRTLVGFLELVDKEFISFGWVGAELINVGTYAMYETARRVWYVLGVVSGLRLCHTRMHVCAHYITGIASGFGVGTVRH
jgi:hypothetical protein